MISDKYFIDVSSEQNEYTQLLIELHDKYCKDHPTDVLQFCSNFFIHKLKEERLVHKGNGCLDGSTDLHPLCEQEPEAHPSQRSNLNAAYMSRQDEDMDEDVDEDEGNEDDENNGEEHDSFSTEPLPSLPPVNYNRGRRTSVSAESIAPSANQNFVKAVIPKTPAQAERIKVSVNNNFLFRNLDEEQYLDVVNAMTEKRVPNNTVIIQQGDVGDFFYVVESGTLDCFIGEAKVTSYESGGSFGELALMYNALRAATIRTTSECVLWALDRITFRTILMENTSRKRRIYEYFLSEVTLLKSLESYEQHKIADSLESAYFEDGQEIVKQGDIGDQFYIIESGEAIVLKEINGVQQQVNKLQRGSYFGELALLNDAPRAATVVAHGRTKCATLGNKAFTRLLGPVLDILKRNSENYHAVINRHS